MIPEVIHEGLDFPVPEYPTLSQSPMFVPREKKPSIHISYIHPPTLKAKEATAELFKGHPDYYCELFCRTYVQNIEHNSRNHFGVRQSFKCDADKIVYNELAERSSVTGLIFHLLGHDFFKMDLQHDFSCYSNTVCDIEFDGHLSYITPAFQIISQLSSLKRVTFNLGLKQLPFYLEVHDREYDLFLVQPNRNTYSLNVKVDPKLYQRGSEKEKVIMNNMIEAIFRRAGQCLPKLAHLDLKLPATDESFTVFEKVLHNCREIKGETFITIEITPILSMVSCKCIIVPDGNAQNRSILSKEVDPFELQLINPSSDTYKRDQDLHIAYEKLKKAFVFLETLARSVPRFPYLPNAEPRVPVPEPPPGFDYLYNRIRIASIQTQSAPRSRRVSTEMDQVFLNINRNQVAIERNQHRMRLSRLIEGFEDSAAVPNHPPRESSGLTRSEMETLMRWYDEISEGNH